MILCHQSPCIADITLHNTGVRNSVGKVKTSFTLAAAYHAPTNQFCELPPSSSQRHTHQQPPPCKIKLIHGRRQNSNKYRLIPKADRKKVHQYLFREGVLVAKKDFSITHPDIETKNLYVVKACQSLTSRGYVKTQFSWQYYYYTLTPEGLQYLREWLHLPEGIVPATHIKQQRSHAPPRGMMGGEGERERKTFGGRGGRGGDREGGYRRRDAGDGKEGGAPGEFAPQL